MYRLYSFDGGDPYENPNISFDLGYLGGDNIVAANGSLFDLRNGSLIKQFDRISISGHSAFHPNGQSLLIDNALWDLRNYGLLCTASVGEHAISSFSASGDVLFTYTPYRESDFDQSKRRLPAHSTIRVLDTVDYKEIYSWSNERSNFANWYLQTDFADDGYLGVLEFSGDASSGGISKSCCTILEIGRRRLDDGDSDKDDADVSDSESSYEDEDVNDINEFEGSVGDSEDDMQQIIDGSAWHDVPDDESDDDAIMWGEEDGLNDGELDDDDDYDDDDGVNEDDEDDEDYEISRDFNDRSADDSEYSDEDDDSDDQVDGDSNDSGDNDNAEEDYESENGSNY